MATHPPRQTSDPFADLLPRLDDLVLRDRAQLRRRIEGSRKVRRPEALAGIRAEIESRIVTAEMRVLGRREDEILATIRDNQVGIVAGETGSGKTTQIPKICLELAGACTA